MLCNVDTVYVLLSVTVFSFSLLMSGVKGDCWDTGCQLDTWLEKGCEVYGMEEVGRRACDGGTIFSCCHRGIDPYDESPASNDAYSSGSRVGDLTYYELGLTACGQWYSDSDMVAALASSHFTTPNPNVDPICGRKLKIVDPASGKSIAVKVVDKCEGCKVSDVDVSPTAFEKLRPLSVGRFRVSWDFV